MRQPAVHHSRVSTLMIDCLDESFAESLAFWQQALGLTIARRPSEKQRYVTLGELKGPITVRLQKVSKDPGLHLDIESDSVSAEAMRMEACGARRKYKIRKWWVLEDPSGNAFCVIRPESAGFPKHAAKWKDAP